MPKLTSDKFRSARGGRARLLSMTCAACGAAVLQYQKDGSGPLKRMYLDRIHAPEKLVGLQTKRLQDIAMLTCGACKRMLGCPYLYKQERRKAFRVFQDAIKKRVIAASR